MSDHAVALVAVRKALSSRSPIVLIHMVSARALLSGDPGLRAIYTDRGGLSSDVANEPIDTSLTRQAAIVLTSGHPRTVTLGPDGRETTSREASYVRFFLDPIVSTPRLLIVGAGHIAQPLAYLSSIIGFETVVVDERADFANSDRFPTADVVQACSIETFLGDFEVDDQTFVVLVTRAHRFDEAALRILLHSSAPYIGMIGSRRRVHVVYRNLRNEGFSSDQFVNVYAPIGLDIGAKTPAEIALAIVAEIVDIRRQGHGLHLSLADFRLDQVGDN